VFLLYLKCADQLGFALEGFNLRVLNLEPKLDLKERRTHTGGMYEELGPEAVPAMVYNLGLQRWRA
jgi:hypothetical protein